MRLPETLISTCIALAMINVHAQSTGQSSADHAAMEPTSSMQQGRMDDAHRRDFDTRAAQIQALMSAYRNIHTEAGNDHSIAATEDWIALQIRRAKKMYQSADVPAGRDILDRAYHRIRTAIIQLRDGKTLTKSRSANEQYEVKDTPPKYLADYQTAVSSIDALLAAYKRVSMEKGQADQGAIMEGNIMAIKVTAARHYQSGGHPAASKLLHGAYTLVKEALASLREGDTLTQSLNFANQQEEYDYYLRKTHSQKMAIEILLEVGRESSNKSLLQRLLTSSQRLLEQAAAQAAQGDFEGALPIMEKVLARLQSGLMMSLSSP